MSRIMLQYFKMEINTYDSARGAESQGLEEFPR